MGTSQVPLVLKLAHRYGQGTEWIQANGLDSLRFANLWDPRETVPWLYLWADLQIKGTFDVPMT